MSVERALSRSGIGVILLACFLPVYIPIMAKYEGVVFPVVDNVAVIEQHADSCEACRLPHIDVFVTFDKLRQCEFVALSWLDNTGRRVRIDFDPELGTEAQTRPTGAQVAGPWRIYGIETLEGTRAIVEHQCHPFYRTYSTFYP